MVQRRPRAESGPARDSPESGALASQQVLPHPVAVETAENATVKLTSRSGFQLRFATGVNLPTSEVLSTPVVKILSRILNRLPARLSLGRRVPFNVRPVNDPHSGVELRPTNRPFADQLKHAAHGDSKPRCRIANRHSVDGWCHDHAAILLRSELFTTRKTLRR